MILYGSLFCFYQKLWQWRVVCGVELFFKASFPQSLSFPAAATVAENFAESIIGSQLLELSREMGFLYPASREIEFLYWSSSETAGKFYYIKLYTLHCNTV